MHRLWLPLAVVAALLGVAPYTAARSPKPPPNKAGAQKPEEELGTMMARRIQRAIGVKVRIRDLVYDLFTSTFVGKGIEVGPPKRPHLKLPHLKLKLVLLAGGPGATVALVEVRRPRATLQLRWIDRFYRFSVHQPTTVRVGRLTGGRLTLGTGAGKIQLRGLNVTVKNLKVPVSKVGVPPALTGTVKLEAGQIKVGSLELGRLVLSGKLDRSRLVVDRLTLGLPGGEVTLGGTIGFGDARNGPGPFALIGPFTATLGEGATVAVLRGKLALKGPTMQKLTLSGKLDGKGLPRRGGIKGVPALDLRLRVGKRSLRGTLRRWRIR